MIKKGNKIFNCDTDMEAEPLVAENPIENEEHDQEEDEELDQDDVVIPRRNPVRERKRPAYLRDDITNLVNI